MKERKVLSWILQLGVVAVLGPAVYFKFVGADEAIDNFTKLGMEPNGRILIGVLELVALVAMLIPGLVAWGAVLGWGLMTGALIAHCTTLGFSGPAFPVFIMAVVTWILCTAICYLRQKQIVFISAMFGGKSHRSGGEK